MARKGGRKHMKRYAAPRALKLPRKSLVWTIKAAPGPHPSESAIPLRLILRDYLSIARTAKEADSALAAGNVLVDGKIRRNPDYPVGIMDVVQFPILDRSYRVFLDHRGRLILSEIDRAEATVKLCKIMRKQIVRGKKVQLTFHDGKTLVGDFNEFKPGDVVKVALPDTKALERFPFEIGAMAMVIGGKNVSRIGKIAEIKLIAGTQPNIVTLKTNGETFQAPEHYVFVVGGEKPAITLQGVSS